MSTEQVATVLEPLPAVTEVPKCEVLTNDSGTFPLHTIGLDAKIPERIVKEGSLSFVLQGINLWQLKNSPIHSVLSPIKDSESFLEDSFTKPHYDPEMIYLVSKQWDQFKFPVDQFRYVMRYFQAIYDKYQSEAAVLLMLNQKTKEWRTLFVIQVSAAGGSVIYAQPVVNPDKIDNKRDKEIIKSVMDTPVSAAYQNDIYSKYNRLYDEGFRIFGTIHSHCNFGAFHSGTDDHDELSFDGLHITIGKVRSGWDYSCRYMASRGAFKIDIKQVLGVDNMNEVQNGVDEIEVEDEHMNLMMPDLLKDHQVKFAVPPPSKSYYVGNFNRQPVTSLGGNREFEWQGKSSNWNEAEYDANVWEEKYVYRVYDWKSDRVLLVTVSYWNRRKGDFKHHAIIPDGDIPDELLNQHSKWKEQQSKKGDAGLDTTVLQNERSENVDENAEIENGSFDYLENEGERTSNDAPLLNVLNVPALSPHPSQSGGTIRQSSLMTFLTSKAKKLIRGKP